MELSAISSSGLEQRALGAGLRAQRAAEQAGHLERPLEPAAHVEEGPATGPRVRFSATSPLKAASRLIPASSSSRTSLRTPRASTWSSSGCSVAVGRGLAIAVRSAIMSTIRWLRARHMSTEIRSRTLEATRCSRASVEARLPGRSRSKITERSSPSGSLDRHRAGSGRGTRDRSGSATVSTRSSTGSSGTSARPDFSVSRTRIAAQQADHALGPLDVAAQPVEVVGVPARQVAAARG